MIPHLFHSIILIFLYKLCFCIFIFLHDSYAFSTCSLPPFLNLDQIGSRITSKRICQIIEDCAPFSYIMVDKHPHRHDPSHIVTHRIQTSIFEFVGCVLKAAVPHTRSLWSTSLQLLSKMVLISVMKSYFLLW